MRPTVFQRAELRDENDIIIQQGTYGKGSALSNSTNDAWIDYVMNNLEALRSMSVGAIIPVETLPESGETGKAYVVTTGTDAGKLFMWDGEDWVEITGSIGDYLPITGGTITGNLAVEGISTAVTPNADDNSTKVATTEYVQTEIKPIETDVDIAEKDIANIKALLQGHLYDYQTDSTSAYTKSVPSGAMPYAGIEQIGGKTVVWNQLLSFTTATYTYGGITWTRNDDNSYTANGTAETGGSGCDVSAVINIPTGHKVLLKGCPAGGSVSTFFLRNAYVWQGGGVCDTGNGYIYTMGSDTRFLARLTVMEGTTVTNQIWKPLVFDLTLMYGAGNEPSTVAEFEAMFPASYYPYNAGTLLSAGVTEVVSKDTNNATLQTYSIPAAIRNLEGYGWSAGSVYNYIDFERKVFVQNVGKKEITSNDVSLVTSYTYDSITYFAVYKPTNYSGYKNYNGAKTISPAVHSSFVPIDRPPTFDSINSIGCIDGTPNNYAFWFGFAKGTTLAQAQNVLAGTEIYYQLTTPVETDISAYLTDDNLIEVEAGGTLTFENQHGTDYQLPVPSEETYMINLQEAINNG